MAKHILVTGGNAGIGKALCKQLAAEDGCHVFMCSRSVEKGNAAVEAILAEAPECKGKIDVVQLDQQDKTSVAAAATSVKAVLGTELLYGIVNNAGTGLGHGTTAAQMMSTNLHGPKLVCESFMPLLDQSTGRIVNVGSGIGPGWMARAAPEVQAILTSPQVTWEQVEQVVAADLAAKGDEGMNAYGLSKAALMSYTHILARTYPSVISSTVSPGFIDTALTQGFGAKLTPEQGTVSIRHCLFKTLGGSGWMWGSDGKRSPIDASREPGQPEYADPTARGY